MKKAGSSNPVFLMDEIDAHMHPSWQQQLLLKLKRLLPNVQVIATTHSPYLLDLFREHPEEIVIAHKRGREVHFERLSDRADVKELLSEGSLGDIRIERSDRVARALELLFDAIANREIRPLRRGAALRRAMG